MAGLNDKTVVSREWQRMMDATTRREEMLRIALGPLDDLRRAGIAERPDPFRQIREVLECSPIQKQVQELLASTSIAFHAQKLMEQYLNPISQQQMLEKLQRQAFDGYLFDDIAKQIERANPAFSAMEAARKSLDDLWGQFHDIDFSQFDADEEDKQETERVVQTITQDASEQQSFQATVERIVAAIEAQKKPTVKLMLWLFFRQVIGWLIAGAIGAVMGHYAPAVLGEIPQAAKKAVQEDERIAVGPPELLVDYRYVSAKILIVRQNPKAQSPEVGRLTFGKAVRLMKKDADFALVHWTNKESGAELQGWVFARYLRKPN